MSFYLRHTFFLCSIICAGLHSTVSLAEEQQRAISLGDMHAFAAVSAPAFSPDGTWVAYVVEVNDVVAKTSISQLYLVAANGGDSALMSAESVSSWGPVFSRDGMHLYFLSARNEEKTQVWSLNLRVGGEAQRVTHIERGVSSINFSPDEKYLLLVLADEYDAEPLVLGSKPWVVDRLQMKRDFVGYLNHLRDHVYIYDITSATLTQITSGDYDDSEPTWSPDGKQVAFVSNRTANPDSNPNSDIWIVDASQGDIKAGLHQVTTNAGAEHNPLWHPDGGALVYLSTKADVEYNYAINHLASIDLETKEVRYLTDKTDRNIFSPRFTTDGKSISALLEDSAEQHLILVNWKTAKLRRLVDGALQVSDYAFDAAGNAVVVLTSDTRPSELYALSRGGRKALSHANDALIAGLALGRTEEIHFKAPDGWDIEGLVTFPPNYVAGNRYPSILLIHGGPVSQYAHGFSYDSQLLAAQGYVVVRSNPRGSSGYGQAFTLGLHLGWGEKDYQDVLAAMDHGIEQGYVDPDRMGMGGYSYGGILTNYLLGHTNRFKAAVSGAGSGLYVASYGHDEYQQWYESELGTPWENRELWERLSPFNYIHKATTPTLFMGGSADWNVPIQGSEQLYQVMKRVGVDTTLVVYPGEHHGGWSFANLTDYSMRSLAWYERYLKLPAKTATAP
ncbi:MAG: dipeptidyl aminopeptidase/acylaminoacyl peptidase [Halieaceae bacterium]|jgi:dipeptidyl aminopeptidase/acylaminoacyl peptidase